MKTKTNILTENERLEAYKEIRFYARHLSDQFKINCAEDEYVFIGSMNDVEDLREALEVIEFDEMRKMGNDFHEE